MGINSINGQIPAVLNPMNATRVPAPQIRASEGASEANLKSQQPQEPKKEQVKQAAKPVEQEMPGINANVPRFTIHGDTKQVIAQIVDEHNKVVRQIPPEDLLRVAARMRKLEGLLFDKTT